MKRIWFTIPCKGRLAFLRESLPGVLALQGAACCLVDYDCPEACGSWAERTFPEMVASGRLAVERVRDRPFFNKAAAHNAGAKRAIQAGADHLVFLDADTLVAPEFLHTLAPALNPHQFWIAARRADGLDDRDLYGFLIVPSSAFQALGGFDERYEGWGVEDLDMRLQLRLILPLIVGEVPLTLLRGMQHDDSLRTQFYDQKDLMASDLANQERMFRKLNAQNGGTIPVEWTSLTERMWCRTARNAPPVMRDVDMVPASELRAARQRISNLEAELRSARADAAATHPGGVAPPQTARAGVPVVELSI